MEKVRPWCGQPSDRGRLKNNRDMVTSRICSTDRYCEPVWPRPTQPPTFSGMGNEYQPKCGDALRLGSKGRYGSFHLWINVWVACKTVSSLVNTCHAWALWRWVIINRYTNLRMLLLIPTALLRMWCETAGQPKS